MAREGFILDFKRNFLTGFAALFPILITVFLLSWFYGQIDRTIGGRVNRICVRMLSSNRPLFTRLFPGAGKEVVNDPEERREWATEHFPGVVGTTIGVLVAALFVYLVGKALRGYIGGRIMRSVDRFFERFPVVKAIYPHARQFADFVFGQARTKRFSHVVAVQYPRMGIYTLGFLTGDGLKDIERVAGQRLVTVFIPTSPTPLTGFIIVVPPDEVTELNMAVDEAFRFCITAGMLASPSQRPPGGGEGTVGSVPSVAGVGGEGTQQKVGGQD